MIGVIQRTIMLTWSFSFTGTTGWMFNTFWIRLYGPIPKLSLFCTGTLIRLETGFWVAFARSAAPSASAVGFVAAGCVAASCASQKTALQANPHDKIA